METEQTKSKKTVRFAEQIKEAVSALLALCTKHARRRITIKTVRTDHQKTNDNNNSSSKVAPRSTFASSKQLFATLSNKAMALAQKKGHNINNEEKMIRRYEEEEKKDFGDGGLWQRAILMGEKCQPPDFSGVIYYDSNGKQLSEMPPRSPRATPLHNMVAVSVGPKN